MITIRDWIPAIPPEEKSLAYVGENEAVSRQFLLPGEDGKTYRDWSFYLDMAFDLSSVTQRDTFQQETTQRTESENITKADLSETTTTGSGTQTVAENDSTDEKVVGKVTNTDTREDVGDSEVTTERLVSTAASGEKTEVSESTHDSLRVLDTRVENTEETITSATGKESSRTDSQTESGTTETESNTTGSASSTVTKEVRTVTEVVVDCTYSTDVAPLDKRETVDGLVLTWTVLRQHTQLPGRLRANIRAVGPAGQVKKSDIMLFMVEPSVVATPATAVPVSEYEQLEQRVGNMLGEARTAAMEAAESASIAGTQATYAGQAAGYAREYATTADTQAAYAGQSAAVAMQSQLVIEEKAAAVREDADSVGTNAAIVNEQAANVALWAAQAAESAAIASAGAEAVVTAVEWPAKSANALRGEVSGQVVRVDDSSPLPHVAPFSVTAKNLITYPFAETSKTENGVTFTDNGDGTITVNGTMGAGVYPSFRIATLTLPAGRYTAYAGEGVSAGIMICNGNNISESPGASPATLTLTATDTINVILNVQSANNLTVRPQLFAELASVQVKHCGKNLLPTTYKGRVTSDDGITFTDNGDGSVTAVGTATKLAQFKLNVDNMLLPPGQYVASGGINGTIRRADGTSSWITAGNPVFTVRQGDYISHLYINIASGTTVNAIYYPMIELAGKATAYEPQRAPTVYTPAADGSMAVELWPECTNTLFTEAVGVELKGSYNRDVNKVIYNLLERVSALEG